MAFDRPNRNSQPRGDVSVGQTLAEQQHDLAFPIGQRQRLARLTKRRGTYATALLGQRFCSGRRSRLAAGDPLRDVDS